MKDERHSSGATAANFLLQKERVLSLMGTAMLSTETEWGALRRK